MNGAFVLGLYASGLALGRVLKKLGFRTFGFAGGPGEPGRHSRAFDAVFPLPASPAGLKAFQREMGSGPIAVFPTTDATVHSLMQPGAPLGEGLIPFLPPQEVFATWFSKDRFPTGPAALTDLLNAPRWATLADWHSLASLPGPWIIKPVDQSKAANRLFVKNALVASPAELSAFAAAHASYASQLIVQEYIRGGDDTLVFCGGYVRENGEAFFFQVGRKMWQSPPGRGVAILSRQEPLPDVVQLTGRFFELARYRGFFDVEWKWDERTRAWRFIEVNLRPWMTLAMTPGYGEQMVRTALEDQGFVLPPHAGGWVEPGEWRDDMDLLIHGVKRRIRPPFTAGRIVAHAYWSPSDPLPLLSQFRGKVRHRVSRILDSLHPWRG